MREYAAPKPWELPKWCVGHARELGLQLDPEAAKELVARVGTSQQRLSRELEKIGLALHPSANVTPADVERLAATDTAPRRLRPRRRARGRRPARDARARRAARRARRAPGPAHLPARAPAARGAPGGRRCSRPACPSRRWRGAQGAAVGAKKMIAKAKKADVATLERAICVFADLEVELRGGGEVRWTRTRRSRWRWRGAADGAALRRRAPRAATAHPTARPRTGTTSPSARSSSRCGRASCPGTPRGPPGRARGRSPTASCRRTARRRCRSAGR